MQETEAILCPFCGQENTLELDTTLQHQRFTTDCEVCCRPFQVTLDCADGEVVSLEASVD
jgi:transposase-like protein